MRNVLLASHLLLFIFWGCESTDTSKHASPAYSCPEGTQNIHTVIADKGVCELKGRITTDLLLSANRFWSINGEVHIGQEPANPVTLKIQPGTTIFGSRGGDFLAITRGSKIDAKGLKESPIVFTSQYDINGEESQAGDWGGVVIAGYARTNTDDPKGEETFEFSNSGLKFGGDDDHDNSGILRYIIIKYAGNEVRPGEELNGLSLGAVGDKTLIDYVEVYNGKDDGIEIWGGTVNLKHVILIGNQDDSFDTDHGYRGNVQYLYIKQTRLDARYARGIEADNDKKRFNAQPRSMPTIANFELHGVKGSKEGIMLRRGTGYNFINGFVEGFDGALLGVHDSATCEFGKPRFNSVSLDGANDDKRLYDGQYTVTRDDVELLFYQGKYVKTHGTDTKPTDTIKLTHNSFFDAAPYIGAYTAEDDWRKDWAVGL